MPDPQEPIDPNETYSMGAAARLRRVSVTTITQALVSGRLPATRDETQRVPRWAIRDRDLLRWEPLHRPVPPELLSVAQAAALTGRATVTITQAIAKGRLRAEKIAGHWRITRADLAAWRRSIGQTPAVGPIEPDRFSTQADAAWLVGTSRQAVHQALTVGTLRATETEDGRRIRGAALLDWRANR